MRREGSEALSVSCLARGMPSVSYSCAIIIPRQTPELCCCTCPHGHVSTPAVSLGSSQPGSWPQYSTETKALLSINTFPLVQNSLRWTFFRLGVSAADPSGFLFCEWLLPILPFCVLPGPASKSGLSVQLCTERPEVYLLIYGSPVYTLPLPIER